MTPPATQIKIDRDNLVTTLAEGLSRADFQDLLLCVDAAGNLACIYNCEKTNVNSRWVAEMSLRTFDTYQDEDGQYPGTESYDALGAADCYINDPPGRTVDELFGSSFVYLADETEAELTLVYFK